jgi:CheY-like chemotaxis protein
VGLLAGGIAHDFNNMLTAINGYSDLTLRQLSEDSPLRGNIEEVRNAGRRSAALIDQLLAFSRRQVLQPVVMDFNEVIDGTIKMLRILLGENIELNASLHPRLGRVIADPGQFSQIIINLAVNARDAMPQGGHLTIETANIFLDPAYTRTHIDFLPGAYVMMAVSDTGIGMSEEIQQKIFEPFFTTKEVGRGTGLGLATVYGIVKQSGGNIEVYSEEGVGSTFKIYMPRVMAEADTEEGEDGFAQTLEGAETILLVEDEAIVRELARQILIEFGYSVVEASNGVEALDLCSEDGFKFDLLLTDVVMPRMGGRELAEKLLEVRPGLPVLFTSGYTDDAIVRHGVIGANANFVQKPFTPETLVGKIREILDKS